MRTKPKTLGVVATWPQRVNHVNYKTQDEEMFLAFHFIQVGKLHDPSKLSSKLSQQCNQKRVFNYL